MKESQERLLGARGGGEGSLELEEERKARSANLLQVSGVLLLLDTPVLCPSSCLAKEGWAAAQASVTTALRPAVSLLSDQWLTLRCPQPVPSSLEDFQSMSFTDQMCIHWL